MSATLHYEDFEIPLPLPCEHSSVRWLARPLMAPADPYIDKGEEDVSMME